MSAAMLSVPTASASALLLLAATLWTRPWSVEPRALLWVLASCLAAATGATLARRIRAPRLHAPFGPGLLSADLRRSQGALGAGVPAVSVSRGSDEMLSSARSAFLRLQSAWDAGDADALRQHTTEAMLEELLEQLPARGVAPNRTEVLTLHAAVLLLERGAHGEIATVEFSGLIRECPDRPAVAFDEVWMLMRAGGPAEPWRLARQQALL